MKIRNEKGFTLVELLAVLVILAFIALIAFPIVTGIINNSREKLSEEQFNRLEEAVKSYTTKNVAEDEACVSISELKSGGYLENVEIKNPDTGETINGIYHIIWDTDHNQYTYQYDGSKSSC